MDAQTFSELKPLVLKVNRNKDLGLKIHYDMSLGCFLINERKPHIDCSVDYCMLGVGEEFNAVVEFVLEKVEFYARIMSNDNYICLTHNSERECTEDYGESDADVKENDENTNENNKEIVDDNMVEIDDENESGFRKSPSSPPKEFVDCFSVCYNDWQYVSFEFHPHFHMPFDADDYIPYLYRKSFNMIKEMDKNKIYDYLLKRNTLYKEAMKNFIAKALRFLKISKLTFTRKCKGIREEKLNCNDIAIKDTNYCQKHTLLKNERKTLKS